MKNSKRAQAHRPVCLLLVMLCAGAVQAAIDPEIQARADQLLRDVEAEPTTNETLKPRARVYWDWINAVGRDGGFVQLNATLVAHQAMNAADMGVGALQLEQFDDFVLEMARSQTPGLLGDWTIEAPVASESLSYQTIVLRYTVGSDPVRQGGAFLLARQFMAGHGELQNTDPSADDYVAIRASREGARFEPGTAPLVGPHGGFRGAISLPSWVLRGADLQPGDTVTLTYGDTSAGGGGLRMGILSNRAVGLPVYVDHGTGLFDEYPVQTFRVVGTDVAGVQGFAPSVVGVGERVAISVRSEDQYYNRASGPIPAFDVTLNGEHFGRIAATQSKADDDFEGALHLLETSFSEPGVYRFDFRSADGGIEGRANPIVVQQAPQERIYWGETHGHCGFAEGIGTPDGYFQFGRDDARLDYLTLSEHDIWLDDGEWVTLNEAADRWSKSGELVVFPGYEWSSPRQNGGHHNVFFRQSGRDRVPIQEAPVLSALYRQLHAKHPIDDVLIIPHAHQAGDWRLSDLSTERLVELVSGHGTFEWFGQYYLRNGFQVGFVGASDDHVGHPGYSPGRGDPSRWSNIHQFGGLGAVFAPAKEPDAIFDGLRARLTYATSGAERIVLFADLNGEPMGTAMEMTEERRLRAHIVGTDALESVTVVKNGEEVHSEQLAAATGHGGLLLLGFESDSQPIIRDNPRGYRPWVGVVEIEGARLVDAALTGKINPHSDSFRIEDGQIFFEIAGRGIRRGIEIEIADEAAGATITVRLEPGREAGRAPVIVRPNARFPAEELAFPLGEMPNGETVHELRTGDFVDSLRLQRLEAEPVMEHRLEWTDPEPGPGDYYYVKARQVDGNMVWSSPWWVGAEPPQ